MLLLTALEQRVPTTKQLKPLRKLWPRKSSFSPVERALRAALEEYKKSIAAVDEHAVVQASADYQVLLTEYARDFDHQGIFTNFKTNATDDNPLAFLVESLMAAVLTAIRTATPEYDREPLKRKPYIQHYLSSLLLQSAPPRIAYIDPDADSKQQAQQADDEQRRIEFAAQQQAYAKLLLAGEIIPLDGCCAKGEFNPELMDLVPPTLFTTASNSEELIQQLTCTFPDVRINEDERNETIIQSFLSANTVAIASLKKYYFQKISTERLIRYFEMLRDHLFQQHREPYTRIAAIVYQFLAAIPTRHLIPLIEQHVLPDMLGGLAGDAKIWAACIEALQQLEPSCRTQSTELLKRSLYVKEDDDPINTTAKFQTFNALPDDLHAPKLKFSNDLWSSILDRLFDWLSSIEDGQAHDARKQRVELLKNIVTSPEHYRTSAASDPQLAAAFTRANAETDKEAIAGYARRQSSALLAAARSLEEHVHARKLSAAKERREDNAWHRWQANEAAESQHTFQSRQGSEYLLTHGLMSVGERRGSPIPSSDKEDSAVGTPDRAGIGGTPVTLAEEEEHPMHEENRGFTQLLQETLGLGGSSHHFGSGHN